MFRTTNQCILILVAIYFHDNSNHFQQHHPRTGRQLPIPDSALLDRKIGPAARPLGAGNHPQSRQTHPRKARGQVHRQHARQRGRRPGNAAPVRALPPPELQPDGTGNAAGQQHPAASTVQHESGRVRNFRNRRQGQSEGTRERQQR